MYQVSFNRDAEPDPITRTNEWVDQLDRGNGSLAQFAMVAALGAQGNDLAVFSSHIRSAHSFTGTIETPADGITFPGDRACLLGISYLDGFGELAATTGLGHSAFGPGCSGSVAFAADVPL